MSVHAGPSAYSTFPKLGSRAKLSTEKSSLCAKMGSMPRFRDVGSSHLSHPGPGQYSSPSLTLESHQPCLPKVGFAKALRDANKKVKSQIPNISFFRVLLTWNLKC